MPIDLNLKPEPSQTEESIQVESESSKSKTSTIESKVSSEIKPTSDKSLPKISEENKSNKSAGIKYFEENCTDKNNKPLFVTKEEPQIRSEIITRKDIHSTDKLQGQFNDTQVSNT